MSISGCISTAAWHDRRAVAGDPPAGRSCSGGHVRGEDVVGVPVEVPAGPVVSASWFRVGVPGGDLHVAEADSRIEHGRDDVTYADASGRSGSPPRRPAASAGGSPRAGPSAHRGCCAGSARGHDHRRLGRSHGPLLAVAGSERSCHPCHGSSARGGRVPRRGCRWWRRRLRESAGINRLGGGVEGTLRRRVSDPRRPRVMLDDP
jgi:hypothetical protein